MLQLTSKAGDQSPATAAADWQEIRALLVGAGFTDSITMLEPNGLDFEIAGHTPGIRIIPSLPVLVTYVGAGALHSQTIGRIKRILEDQGYDLATRGPAQSSYLAVYGRCDAQEGGAA